MTRDRVLNYIYQSVDKVIYILKHCILIINMQCFIFSPLSAIIK